MPPATDLASGRKGVVGLLRTAGTLALHTALFFAATAWGFDVGHQVAGAWLGMLMGLQAGVFAVLMASGLPAMFRRLGAWANGPRSGGHRQAG